MFSDFSPFPVNLAPLKFFLWNPCLHMKLHGAPLVLLIYFFLFFFLSFFVLVPSFFPFSFFSLLFLFFSLLSFFPFPFSFFFWRPFRNPGGPRPSKPHPQDTPLTINEQLAYTTKSLPYCCKETHCETTEKLTILEFTLAAHILNNMAWLPLLRQDTDWSLEGTRIWNGWQWRFRTLPSSMCISLLQHAWPEHHYLWSTTPVSGLAISTATTLNGLLYFQ